MESTLVIQEGIRVIWDYDNIAIVVLMVCLVLSILMNFILVRGLLKMKDVFNTLNNTITVLNERIGH